MLIFLLLLITTLISYFIYFFLKQKTSKRFAILTSLVLGVSTISLYMLLGSPQKVMNWETLLADAAIYNKIIQNPDHKSPDNIIFEVKGQLQKNPKSAQGWFILGKLYAAKKDYQAAADAYTKAYAIAPTDVELNAAYAQTLYLQQQGQTSPQLITMLDYVISQEPQHPSAVNLLATISFNNQDYQKALDYWRQIVDDYAAESDAGKTIRAAMNKAQQKITENSVNHLAIEISVAKELQQQIAKAKSLFVIVKEKGANLPPLWVIKVPVGEFPLKVELTNQNAMMQNRLLPKNQPLQIIARLSMTGEPFAKEGDLQGEKEITLSTNSSDIFHIVIDAYGL